jgi:hypothetical protein
MERKMMKILDDLTVEQTERLLDESMELKISGKDRRRIKNAVFEKIGLKQKKRFYFPQKLAACAAAIALVFITLSAVGFDNVAAAFGRLLTFIPGVGIVENNTETVYAVDPVTGQTKIGDVRATLAKAVYSNGHLSATVMIDGKNLFHDDFKLYINQEYRDYRGSDAGSFSLAVSSGLSSGSTMLNFAIKTAAPTGQDLYEIEITGFPERLSFKMIPCREYDDLAQIGPTDTQNGISLTVTAHRFDGQLTVWCYPFRGADAVKDRIMGYGVPSNGAYVKRRYIETESGRIDEARSGIVLQEQFVFEMPESDQTATLHIPYLSMLREEKDKLRVALPDGYGTVESGASIETSLGTIRVTEITRSPKNDDDDNDEIKIRFAFDSKGGTMTLYSFEYDFTADKHSFYCSFDGEKGSLDYFGGEAGKNDREVIFDITGLYYYLYGEYVIPLDVR